jgi:hypothetical protein
VAETSIQRSWVSAPQCSQRGGWNRCASLVLMPIGRLNVLTVTSEATREACAVFGTAYHSLLLYDGFPTDSVLPACGNAQVVRRAPPG